MGRVSSIGPRGRFLLLMAGVYLISLVLICAITYLLQRDIAVRHAYESGRMFLTHVDAARSYVKEELRPVLYRELPGRFLLEGMSRSYVSARIAERAMANDKSYVYKDAIVGSAHNPNNLADPFETSIIKELAPRAAGAEWKGIHERDGGTYFVLARRGDPFTRDCLLCHGDPAAAPEGLSKRYGPDNGFHMAEGQVADAKFIYIPISTALAEAARHTFIFAGIYTALFVLMLLIIAFRFRNLYSKIESYTNRAERLSADVTEMSQEMTELVSERTMALVGMTVADRVRNPAAVIGGTARHLREQHKNDAGLNSGLDDIVEEAKRLEVLVRDFESFRQRRHAAFAYVNIADVVMEVEPLVRREAEAAGVVLDLKLPQSPLKINAERHLLAAAVLYTVRNAIEATASGDTVRVTLTGSADEAVLSVADSGPGIPAEDSERIFDPFFSTRLLHYGLGLPLVRQIVNEHLGEIYFESVENAGTTFHLRFPLRWFGKSENILAESPDK